MANFKEGDFSAYDLLDINLTLADMWGDNHTMYDQYKKPLTCFSDIFTQQAVRIPERFLDPSDCTTIKLAFICDDCNLDTMDCEDDKSADSCEIPDGIQIAADMIEYAPDGCFKSKVYKVEETECKNRISFQQKVAYALMKQLYSMDCKLLELFYGHLATCASDLTLEDGKDISQKYGLGTVADDVWQLAQSAWKPEIMAKLECLTEDCMWTRPMFLTGSIWREFFKLQRGKSGGGCCDYDNMLNNSMIDIKHDIYKFDQVFPGPKTGFLFDASKVAYYNIYRNKNVDPMESPASNRMWKWHINSPRHRWTYTDTNGSSVTVPVKYDAYGQWKCISRNCYAWCWYIEHNGHFLKAPVGNCGTCPTVIQMEQPCVDC